MPRDLSAQAGDLGVVFEDAGDTCGLHVLGFAGDVERVKFGQMGAGGERGLLLLVFFQPVNAAADLHVGIGVLPVHHGHLSISPGMGQPVTA